MIHVNKCYQISFTIQNLSQKKKKKKEMQLCCAIKYDLNSLWCSGWEKVYQTPLDSMFSLLCDQYFKPDLCVL